MKYPHAAGYTEPTTSKAAAEKIERSGRRLTIRDRVLNALEDYHPMTAYEMADHLSLPFHSVQPRLSELHAEGKVAKFAKVMGPYGTHVWKWSVAWMDVPLEGGDTELVGPDDLSDDADALASAGWGTDEDYGAY